LIVALGSSLRVTPAVDIVSDAGSNPDQQMVIINLQKTPMDKLANLCIYGFVDDIVEKLMEKLGLTVPKWKLDRWTKLKLNTKKDGTETLTVSGMDKLGGAFELWKKIYVNNSFGGEYKLKP
jgi:hypothetical protein